MVLRHFIENHGNWHNYKISLGSLDDLKDPVQRWELNARTAMCKFTFTAGISHEILAANYTDTRRLWGEARARSRFGHASAAILGGCNNLVDVTLRGRLKNMTTGHKGEQALGNLTFMIY